MTRAEFSNALHRVILISLALIAGADVLMVGVMLLIGFQDAWLHLTLATLITAILAPAGAFPLVVMSDRVRAVKDELEAQLRIDGLTELPNRRAFFEEAKIVFSHDSKVSMMMIDVDHFKRVNDTHGHDIGDRVLRSVAQSIHDVVAATPGNGARFAARIGGEEFAVLVEDLDEQSADKLANDLVLKIRQSPVRGRAHAIPVTVSAGVAHRRAGDDPDVVLRAADNACYRAKRLGRNQWHDADVMDSKPVPAKAAEMSAA